MKSKITTLLVAGMAWAATGRAQSPTAASAGSAGLLNDFLRQQHPAFTNWDLGGQVRGRFEFKSGFAVAGAPGAVDFSRTTPDNHYWLLREKVHVGWSPAPWVTLFGEARDSRSWDDQRAPEPEEDSIDLQQAFVVLGNANELPLTLKLGRQELSYGDERLVGAFDWNNLGRVFDAARLRYEDDTLRVDAFSGRVVIPRDDTFNTVNDYDWFSGGYASTRTLIPKQETQLYFLARNVGRPSPTAFDATPPALVPPAGPCDIYTLGLRVQSLPGQFHGWDYEAELAGQFGNFRDATLGKRLAQEALAAHLGGGHTFEHTAWKPRVGLEYDYSSGDRDPTDDRHETFDNLFPTNHKFYGFMDFVSWQNLHHVRFTASARPLKGLTLTADYHLFWLAETGDYFYSVSGAPRQAGGYGIRPGYDRFAGSELEVIASYPVRRFGLAQLGYGHFFRGDYVKQTLAAAGSKDADWFYAQLTFTF